MWRRVRCGAGCGFPDVEDEDGKVRERAIMLLMLHIGKTGMQPGEGSLVYKLYDLNECLQ